MPSTNAQRILALLAHRRTMDGPDIETATGLSETAIKAAAVELRSAGFIKTSGASDIHEDDGMAIDRLEITASGIGQSRR